MATNDLTQSLYIDPELSGLARQRQMAQLLVQQGLQTPQADMVGNRYVPVNPMERIGNLASALIGQRGNEVLDVKQNQIADILRQRGAQEIENIYKAMETGGTKAAWAEALKGSTQQSQTVQTQLAKQMFEPEWKPEKRYENGMEINGWVNVKSQNPAATFIASSKRPDFEYAKAVDEGYLPNGGGSAATPYNAPGQVPVSVRNNNPGNLVGADGQFLKFSTPQEGELALMKDLTLKLNGQSPAYKARFGNEPVTPLTLAETWSPAKAKGNSPQSTANYSNFIASQLGISPNQPIPNTLPALNVLKSAITQFESGAYTSPQTQNVDNSGLSPKAKRAVDQKTAEARAEYAQKAPAAIEFMNQTIDNINAMIGDAKVNKEGKVVYGEKKPHAGFELAVGAGIPEWMPLQSGTDVADFRVRFKQLEGQGFLQAFETLKGAGQITEIEGAKATAALNRMNLAQSEKEFITAAREFESNVKKGMEIAKERAGITSAPTGAKLRWNPQTNKFE